MAALATSRKFFEAEPLTAEMVIKSVIEGIHFYKSERTKTIAVLKKYMKLDSVEELQETYSFYVELFAEKPYPTAKGIQTILDWSRRADARKPIRPSSSRRGLLKNLTNRDLSTGCIKDDSGEPRTVDPRAAMRRRSAQKTNCEADM